MSVWLIWDDGECMELVPTRATPTFTRLMRGLRPSDLAKLKKDGRAFGALRASLNAQDQLFHRRQRQRQTPTT